MLTAGPLLLLLAVLSPSARSQPQWTSPSYPRPGPNSRPVDDGCDCYVVSGPDPGYFRHHRFYDFRHSGPLSRSDADNVGGDAIFRHDFPPSIHPSLYNTNFARDFAAQNWVREASRLYPVTTATSYKNVFRARTESPNIPSHLIMRTGRFANYTSASEVVSRKRDYHHCSIRVKLKLYSPPPYRPPPSRKYTAAEVQALSDPFFGIQAFNPPRVRPPVTGAVAGIFVYHSRWSESDIEILTKDRPTTIHYANQPDWDPITDEEIPGSHDIVTIPKPWTSWSTHRLDWFPHISRWYLDGRVQNEKKYGVPTEPSLLAINLWSNGGVWSGDIPLGSAIYMGIEWIEVVYNKSHTQVPSSSTSDRVRRDRLDDEDGNYYEDDDDDYPGYDYYSEDDDYDDESLNQNPIPNEAVPLDSALDEVYLRIFNTTYTRPRPPPLTPVFASNPEAQDEKPCKRVCRIDRVRRVGVPEPVTSQPVPPMSWPPRQGG